MAEKLTLRKGSAVRVITLDGSAVTVKAGEQKPKRTGWLNGVMARSKRDGMVEELKAAGWTLEATKAKKPKKQARALEWSEVKVVGKAEPIALPASRTAWPADYAEFLARFGAGILEDLIILPPAQVKKRTAMWKKSMAPVSAKLWPNIGEHLEDASKLMVIAASQNGDLIGFVAPDALLLFPRGSSRVLAAGATFAEALAMWCFSDELSEPRATKTARFEPL